jgi:hypothetical protein
MNITFKQFLIEEHDIKELLKRKLPLTDPERIRVEKTEALMQDSAGRMVPAIWKSVNQAEDIVYIAPMPNRGYKILPTLQDAIDTYNKFKPR